MPRKKTSSRAFKRRQLRQEIQKLVAQFNTKEDGLYFSLVQLGWNRRHELTAAAYQRELLRAELPKERASEVRVILEADQAVVPDFIENKRLSFRQAIVAARAWRRKQNGCQPGAAPQDTTGSQQERAREDIVQAADRLVRLMLARLTPEENVFAFETGAFRFELRPSEEGLRLAKGSVTPS